MRQYRKYIDMTSETNKMEISGGLELLLETLFDACELTKQNKNKIDRMANKIELLEKEIKQLKEKDE